MNAPPKTIPPPLPEKTPDEPIPADAVPPMADDFIKSRIFTVRGVQVMLDRDLAALYGVEVKQLNRQVKRNIERFPPDFMFQLSREECLRCQIGTLNAGRGQNLKYVPYAFTENGIAMLSGVLRSPLPGRVFLLAGKRGASRTGHEL